MPIEIPKIEPELGLIRPGRALSLTMLSLLVVEMRHYARLSERPSLERKYYFSKEPVVHIEEETHAIHAIFGVCMMHLRVC